MFDLLSIKRLVVKKILVIFPFIKLILPKNKHQLQTDILSVETLYPIDNCARFTLQIEIRIRPQHGTLISEPHSPESNSINRIHCEISIKILFTPMRGICLCLTKLYTILIYSVIVRAYNRTKTIFHLIVTNNFCSGSITEHCCQM